MTCSASVKSIRHGGLAAVSLLFWTSQTPSQRNASVRVTADQNYRAGETFEPIGVNLAPKGPTLVMYVRSNCEFCTASMAFYNRMTKGKSEGARVVVVGPEPEEQLRRYVAEHGLIADQVISVQRGVLRFAGTPTLVLLDRDGRIRRVWQGQLAVAQEKEVEESLR
jgi:peroxiredoxin